MKFNEIKVDIIFMPPDKKIGAATDTFELSMSRFVHIK